MSSISINFISLPETPIISYALNACQKDRPGTKFTRHQSIQVQLLKNKTWYNGKKYNSWDYILLNNYSSNWPCGTLFSFFMTEYRRWDKTNWNNCFHQVPELCVYSPLCYSQTAIFTLPGQSLTQLHIVRDLMVREWLLLWMSNRQIYSSDLTNNKNTFHGISEPFPKDISRTRLPLVAG